MQSLGGFCEALEGRTLLSAISAVATPMLRAHPESSSDRTYVIGFYGLGGASFGNSWLAETVDTVGGAEGATTRLYQQDQGEQGVIDLFKSIDTNGDHILSAAEISAVNVNVIGYSFGGVAASEFTRALTATGNRGLYGYRLAKAVPVGMLVTIDPVNTQPGHYTAGPVGNVQNFVSYYQDNSGSSSIALTVRGSHRSAGVATFGPNATGGPLQSSAQNTSQTLVDDGGPLADDYVTQAYSHLTYGTLEGSGVNHMTMPWYLYERILGDFGV